MGGVGSGNRWRFSSRNTCESYLRLDLRYLHKQGMLKAGYGGSLNWTRNGEPSGTIGYRAQFNGLQLSYSGRPSGHDDWQSISEFIPYQFSNQNYGGQRRWLSCLSCGCKCAVLYGGTYFRCRKCYGLSYQSQSESGLDTLYAQSRRIRRRLGASMSLDKPIMEKPKGMHWRTFHHLVEKENRIADKINFALMDYIEALRRII